MNDTDAAALIAAWVRWEQHPGLRQATVAKADALHATGIDPNRAHDHIGAWRRAGYSIPDAVQTLINNPEEEPTLMDTRSTP